MASSTPTSPSSDVSMSTPASPASCPRERGSVPTTGPNAGSIYREKSKKDITYSYLHNPLTVDFQGPEALERRQSKNCPKKLYRYHSENAATLSPYVNKINHLSHRDVPDLKLQDGNAFQSVGTLKFNLDITRERMTRHYKTQMKREPSAYISALPSLKDAEETLRKMHKTRISPPRRMFIAEIDTSGLWPATLKTKMSTTQGDHFPDNPGPRMSSTTDRDVEIPIWVQDVVPYEGDPTTRPSSSLQEIVESGGQIWMSVEELTRSDMKLWAMASHENEWLTVSQIRETFITNVYPFDGAVLHTGKGDEAVRNRVSEEIYLWNFDTKMWVHNPDPTDFRGYRLARIGEKRKADEDADEDADLDSGSDTT